MSSRQSLCSSGVEPRFFARHLSQNPVPAPSRPEPFSPAAVPRTAPLPLLVPQLGSACCRDEWDSSANGIIACDGSRSVATTPPLESPCVAGRPPRDDTPEGNDRFLPSSLAAILSLQV